MGKGREMVIPILLFPHFEPWYRCLYLIRIATIALHGPGLARTGPSWARILIKENGPGRAGLKKQRAGPGRAVIFS